MIPMESTEAQLEKTSRDLVRSDLEDLAVAMDKELVLLSELYELYHERVRWVSRLALRLGATLLPKDC